MQPWKQALNRTLNRLQHADPCPRVVVLGVGNELRGDDALGVLALRELQQSFPNREDLQLIEASVVPENFCGPIRRFAPHLVLVLDAAEMGRAPGAIEWIETHQADGMTFSTHALPLPMMLDYLEHETGCATAILGIQPANLTFGASLDVEVRHSVAILVEELVNVFASLERAGQPSPA